MNDAVKAFAKALYETRDGAKTVYINTRVPKAATEAQRDEARAEFDCLRLLDDKKAQWLARNALNRSRGAAVPLLSFVRWNGGQTAVDGGETITRDWEQLAAWLTEEGQTVRDKSVQTYVNLTTNPQGYRDDANTTQVLGFGLDCDATGEPTHCRQLFDRIGLGYVLYETSGHRADKPKWRLLGFFDRPFDIRSEDDKKQCKALLRKIQTACGLLSNLSGHGFDPAMAKLSQPIFVGNRPSEDHPPRQVVWKAGRGLNVEAFVRELEGVDEVRDEAGVRIVAPKSDQPHVDTNDTPALYHYFALRGPTWVGPEIRKSAEVAFYPIRCPWNALHTKEGKLGENAHPTDSTVLFKGPLGAVKCMRNSCGNKTAIEVLERLKEIMTPEEIAQVEWATPATEQAKADVPRTKPALTLVRCAAEIKMEAVDWLWDHRIPFAAMTILDGDPGLGKSTMLMDLVARVTRGEPLPGDQVKRDPMNVVVISYEDSDAATSVPRLAAAGADLHRVFLWNINDCVFKMPDDLDKLEQIVTERDIGLVTIDPLMAALSGDVNSHRDQDVRGVLSRLGKMAERTGAAVVLARHLNKGGGSKAIYRGGGSIGIIGAARAGFVLVRDPEEPTSSRILSPTKNNLGKEKASLRVCLVAAPSPAVGIHVAKTQWMGEVNIRADELMVEEDDKGAYQEAVNFLKTAMAKGQVQAKQVQRDAKENGIAERTLNRAKQKLGVRSAKAPQGWMWAMPKPA